MELILLRHAKSSWEHEDLDDYDRPLAERGIKDCKAIRDYINEQGLYPDLIICSASKRTKDTINLVYKNNLNKLKIIYLKELYQNGINTIINAIAKTDNKIKTIMIAGHNPEMELLVENITGKDFPYEKFSTAGLAILDLEIKSWNEIKGKTGKLKLFITPQKIRKLK